jgi:predicted RND superfamily exporter protein/pimeloyl-ACP methyl ester carboxylesterase
LRFAIEALFGRWGCWVAEHARTVIVVALAVSAGLACGLAYLQLDTTSRGFLRNDDPAELAYERYRAEFGRDVDILVVLEPHAGFSLDFLATLAAFHDALAREVPQLERVTSLANARTIFSRPAQPAPAANAEEAVPEDDDEWMGDAEVGSWVGSLRDRWPHAERDVAAFVDSLRTDPLYRNRLISADGRLAAIVLKTQPYTARGGARAPPSATPRRDFITGEEDAAIVAAVRAVAQRFTGPDLTVHIVGAPVFAVELQRAMRRDMGIFTALALATIAGLLFLLFRRPAGVTLPLGVVGLSVAATLGAMALLGTPIRVPTQVLPSFLLAVGVCGSVHLLVIFFRHYDAGAEPGEAVARALAHSGLAIVLTGLTTAAGLFSFTVAEIAPIGEFGWYGALGVLVGLVYTLVLLPAVLVALPPKRVSARTGRAGGAPTEPFLLALGRAATRRPWAAVAGASLLLVAGGLGMGRITLSHDPLVWLPASSETRRSAERVDDAFRGIMSLEVLVHTDRKNGLLEPALLRRIDGLEYRLRGLQVDGVRVGQVLSGVDTLKTWRAASGPDSATLPVTRQALVNDLVRLRVAAGNTGMAQWMDEKRDTGRISIRVPWTDAVHYPPLIAAVKNELNGALGEQARWEVTGATAVMSQTVHAVMQSLIRSYLIALALITPLMVFMIGSLRQGLISMVPNLAPIGLTLGVMGWAGIPVDVFTLLVGCIAIGLAVDDTIHFMHVFRSAHLRCGSVDQAVETTLRTTGPALLFTSLVLATGFSLYAASSMENLRRFGGLIALALSLAFIANVYLAPALLKLVFRRERAKPPPEPGRVRRRDEPNPALLRQLRESAARQGCDPLWLQRGELPAFESFEEGRGGPRLILLHGLLGAISNWDQALPALARFSRVSALSFPLLEGHRSEVTVQALAVYVEAFLRSRGIERAVLCGNSMGGHVALRVALHAPDLIGGLVLTGTSGLYEHEPSQMPLRPGEHFVRDQMRRVFHSERWITPEGVAEIAAILRERHYILTLIQAARSARRDNLQHALPGIAAPTLLLWGEEDQVTPLDVARTFEALMPNAELITTPQCGHAPMIEAADWFVAEVERFVVRLDGNGLDRTPPIPSSRVRRRVEPETPWGEPRALSRHLTRG